MDGTDPDEVLRNRVNLNVPIGGSPAIPARAHVDTSVKRTGAGKGTRPDREGMKRASLYVKAAAMDRLDAAADRIMEILGPGTPRHVVLSALLDTAAAQAHEVARELVRKRQEKLATG